MFATIGRIASRRPWYVVGAWIVSPRSSSPPHSPAASLLDRPERRAAPRRGSLLDSCEPSGVVSGVSTDILPAWEVAGYREFTCEPSPWAQGAALRALAALHGSQAPT